MKWFSRNKIRRADLTLPGLLLVLVSILTWSEGPRARSAETWGSDVGRTDVGRTENWSEEGSGDSAILSASGPKRVAGKNPIRSLFRGQELWLPEQENVDGYVNMTSESADWEEHNVQSWSWQALPAGLIYPSYLAGRKEPRLGCEVTNDRDYGWLWDITLGGRAPILRYGSTGAVRPEGWQVDLEGAALLRLDFERQRELAATDYRAGVPLTYGIGDWQFKLAYYHVSSHLGDNYILDDFRMPRVQYVRDEVVFGVSWRPWVPLRLYLEGGYAFHTGATTEPGELQFGAEYSRPYERDQNPWGSPFAAVDVHLFQELDFGGYINTQAGWQWRGPTNNLLRLGLEFYSGCDDQFQFHNTYAQKFGVGLWYDF